MRLISTLLASILLMQAAAHAEQGITVGSAVEYFAGPYSFFASPVSFDGSKLGYASSDYKPQSFSKNYWVYLSCVITPENPEFDGECTQWKLFDSRTRKTKELKLPGFENFWSVPAFSWPYVAYVQVGKHTNQDQEPIYCVVFDYQKKSIVRRQKQMISHNSFATDFPHMFTPPAVGKKNGHTFFAFGFDDAGNQRTICDLRVP